MSHTKAIPQSIVESPTIRLTVKSALSHLPGTVWILIDYVVSLLAVLLALVVLPDRGVFLDATTDHGFDLRWYLFLFALVAITLAHVFGLHEPHLTRDPVRLAINLLAVFAFTAIVLTTANSVIFRFSGGLKVLLLASAIGWSGIFLTRVIYWRITDEYVHRVCLIGDRAFLDSVSGELATEGTSLTLRKVAIEQYAWSLDDAVGNAAPLADPVAAGTASEGRDPVKAWILRQSFDEIVTQASLPPDIMSPAVSCLDRGAQVFAYPQFVENHLKRVPVRQLTNEWFLYSTLLGLDPHYRIAKRLFDLGIATAGLLLTAPIVVLAALAIRLTSRGPAFYSQTRVGLYNQPFRIYKLRTMTTNAEQSGAQWAKKADPRVTPLGRLLRKTRIDELPQFWNILRGDMAFIGPRPERPEFTRELAEQIPFYEKRHLVKPGLTGWAQINYPYGASVTDALKKLEYDLYYIKHGSLQLDLHIVVRTLGAIMKGAR